MVYDIISRLNEIFFVLISVLISFSFSFLINIGKEMSLPGFRIKAPNKNYIYFSTKIRLDFSCECSA